MVAMKRSPTSALERSESVIGEQAQQPWDVRVCVLQARRDGPIGDRHHRQNNRPRTSR